MSRFIQLLDEEQNTLCAPRVTPLVRSQNRIWRLPLTAMEDVVSAVSAASANWQRQYGFPRRAA